MTISHHLSDVTLQDYSAGALDHSMEVVVACHLTYCTHCRERSNLTDTVGGIMLAQGENSTPKLSALAFLQQVEAGANPLANPVTNQQSTTETQEKLVTGVPRPLGRLLPTPLEDLDWKRIAPGIKQHNLTEKSRKEGAFKLLRLEPGVVLSQHTHQDKELTLVLQGSYQDEIGRFRRGDIADLDDDVVHQPVVDTDQPCIALIATLSPVRFSGMLGKLMQPFVGI